METQKNIEMFWWYIFCKREALTLYCWIMLQKQESATKFEETSEN